MEKKVEKSFLMLFSFNFSIFPVTYRQTLFTGYILLSTSITNLLYSFECLLLINQNVVCLHNFQFSRLQKILVSKKNQLSIVYKRIWYRKEIHIQSVWITVETLVPTKSSTVASKSSVKINFTSSYRKYFFFL